MLRTHGRSVGRCENSIPSHKHSLRGYNYVVNLLVLTLNVIQHPESASSLKVILRILSIFQGIWGIQSFLIFGDICQKK